MNPQLLVTFAFLLATSFYSIGQYADSFKTQKEDFTKIDTTYKYKSYFDIAYNEIKQMLQGKKPTSLKRAIFLTENAYHDGRLDEKWFNKKIDTIENLCRQMIAAKGLQGKPTSGNWAIFGYMTQPVPFNNNKPYNYDYENLITKSENQFVYGLLQSRKGTCHSLPLLYLILAQDLNTEAYLVLAPMHLFIKHKDQYGEWWNLELTGGGYSRTAFIVESFQITDKQIASGLYMKPLNKMQTVAYLLEDLRAYYEEKTGIYWDDFNMKVCELGLKYLPASTLLCAKENIVKYRLDRDMAKVGLNDYKKISSYPQLVKQYNELENLINKVSEMGYKEISEQWYKQQVEEAFKYKKEKEKTKS